MTTCEIYLAGWAQPPIWYLRSRLVVKCLNDTPKILTKWWSFYFGPTMQKNYELAQLRKYLEIFPDIVADYEMQSTQLSPWH